jgi:predicted RecA/RadA family phage recombinase
LAINRVYADESNIALPVPSGTLSGGPVVIGDLPGVALIDRDADGEATLDFDGAYRFPNVKGIAPGGSNGALAVGQVVHLQSNGDISGNTSTGKRFGYVLEVVASGATVTALVKVGY